VKGDRIYSNGFGFESSIAVRIRAPAAAVVPKPEPQIETGAFLVSGRQVTTPELEASLALERARLSPKVARAGADKPDVPETSRRCANRDCEGMHKPGDTLNCDVTFDRQTDFTSVYLLFSTPVGAVVQSGLCGRRAISIAI
jgi:hypothetical protein